MTVIKRCSTGSPIWFGFDLIIIKHVRVRGKNKTKNPHENKGGTTLQPECHFVVILLFVLACELNDSLFMFANKMSTLQKRQNTTAWSYKMPVAEIFSLEKNWTNKMYCLLFSYRIVVFVQKSRNTKQYSHITNKLGRKYKTLRIQGYSFTLLIFYYVKIIIFPNLKSKLIS